MNARETLKLISKQWCDINDLMKLAEIGKNNAVKLRREIKDELILKGYTLPNNRLPMIEVVNKLKININYLEKMAKENLYERNYIKTIEELKCSIADINYIIEDMIRENGLYCLLGEAKVGKSAIALQIANSVANGFPFLNLKTNKTPVLYLSTEMNPSETINRIKFMELNLSNKDFFYTFPEDNLTQISILKVEKEIAEFSEKYNGKLVFIDMFNGINFGNNYDLNNYQDMSQNIFPQLRKLCNNYNVAIIIVHHLNRKGKSLGSTAIDTCVDGKIALKQDENIKLKDFNIEHFEKWKKEINTYGYSTNHKNHIFKFFKELLNYASKWYDFNFTATYNKMTNFTNLNEMPKEMLFFTYEEFKSFISVEEDILYKTMYETLYYCGLRRGEQRGLTWNDIDFGNSYLKVNKNVVATQGDENKPYMVTTPKTKSSIREIPIPKVLLDDLKELYKVCEKHYGFNNKWYVFGDTDPITNGRISSRKNRNCKLAGVKQIRIHDFRHSCASLLINSNASINVVAKYIGHTKIDETLNTYSHLFKNKMNEIIDIIDKLN